MLWCMRIYRVYKQMYIKERRVDEMKLEREREKRKKKSKKKR